jgi:hypothetical protein
LELDTTSNNNITSPANNDADSSKHENDTVLNENNVLIGVQPTSVDAVDVVIVAPSESVLATANTTFIGNSMDAGTGVAVDVTTNTEKIRNNNTNSISCKWSPETEHECIDLVTQRIHNHLTVPQHRWMFFGDSTMSLMYLNSNLSSLIESAPPHCAQCTLRHAQRCDLDKLIGMERVAEWQQPNTSRGEGPVAYGRRVGFCHDCIGCDTRLQECEPLPDPTCDHAQTVWGAYWAIEFARDVELQSPMYNTTQENVVAYIRDHWNTVPDMNAPICVALAGIHDMAVYRITLPTYIESFRWYLSLLHSVCSHVIWLGNARMGGAKEYSQTTSKSYAWNRAMEQVLQEEDPSRNTFWDVFDRSLLWNMSGNVHMELDWYAALGSTFEKVVRRLLVDEKQHLANEPTVTERNL